MSPPRASNAHASSDENGQRDSDSSNVGVGGAAGSRADIGPIGTIGPLVQPPRALGDSATAASSQSEAPAPSETPTASLADAAPHYDEGAPDPPDQPPVVPASDDSLPRKMSSCIRLCVYD